MISFPVWLLLIPFGIFVLFFILYSIINFFHLLRFGVRSKKLYIVMVVFLFATIWICSDAITELSNYNWDMIIRLGGSYDFKSSGLFDL
ncbi:MAG: hypothetical protein ABIH21_02555 [Patescibacteria group bacterium]